VAGRAAEKSGDLDSLPIFSGDIFFEGDQSEWGRHRN
jgi:hypothetical protein